MAGHEVDRTVEELEQVYRESVLGGIKVWGEALVKARDNLSASQWDAVENRLKLTHRQAEIDAAIAVGTGQLDARLFPDGIAASKILLMPPEEQSRLLSAERFKVYSDDGSGQAVALTWLEMSPIQRNRLIGPKNGRILTLAEQHAPKGAAGRVKIGLFTSASYRSGDGYMTIRNGNREARIALSDIAGTLGTDEFEEFVQDMHSTFGTIEE